MGNSVSGVDNRPKKNELYYWDLLVFQVEDELFRVPRYRFEQESPVFRGGSMLPVGVSSGSMGCSNDVPIVLEDVTKADFSAFLKILYPLSSNMPEDFSKARWFGILKLSYLWECSEIKEKAISALLKMNLKPVELIEYGRKFKLSFDPESMQTRWPALREGLICLADEIENVSNEEAKRVGYDYAWRCAKARLRVESLDAEVEDVCANGGCSSELESVPEELAERAYAEALKREIDKEFEVELRDTEDVNPTEPRTLLERKFEQGEKRRSRARYRRIPLRIYLRKAGILWPPKEDSESSDDF